jgi:enamine deaminase RidA (YjgF/YER057c/UK114 family)
MATQQTIDPYQGWAEAVAAGPFLFVSGQLGWRRDRLALCLLPSDLPAATGIAERGGEWVQRRQAPVAAQAHAIYGRYAELLGREGGNVGNILRYHIYQRDKHSFPVFNAIRRGIEPHPPASTAVGMGRFLPQDGATLCIDAIALRPQGAASLGPRQVRPGASAHIAAAHFSHVIGTGPYLFLAGQIPIDGSRPGSPLVNTFADVPPEGRFLQTGRSHEDARTGPIAVQTWFTYDLIRQHLEAEGSSLASIVNLVVYLQDMRDFAMFHRVHEHFFGEDAPALTVIEAREVGHKGTLIEIEPTAVVPGQGVERRVHNPPDWNAPARMNAMVAAGDLGFMSGIVGTNADGDAVASAGELGAAARALLGGRGEASSAALQAAAIVAELIRCLQGSGQSMDKVVHLSVYLKDMDEWAAVGPILQRALGSSTPALTLLESPAPAPLPGAVVSVTAIVWLGAEHPEQMLA